MDGQSSISFGDDVILKGAVEIRSINGAFVHFEDDVRLDVGVRIVATNASTVRFCLGSDIGCYSIFNCGDDFEIGSFALVAGFCYFQTSDHKTSKGVNIKDQGYVHKSIRIGSDCWIGGGSFVLGGANLENGVVVGANSVVTASFSQDSIIIGSPAKFIRKRLVK
jgi:acetyltransferase-like isoleucine patch superfamily enzyme